MAKRDTYHKAVRSALNKEGWTITHDPLHLRSGGVEFYVDLGAERLLAAEKGDERIAVEVKSFVGTSEISEFYIALGQFLSYREALSEKQPARVLYVAVPDDAWTEFFVLPFVEKMRRLHQMTFIVFDPRTEMIRQWIRP